MRMSTEKSAYHRQSTWPQNTLRVAVTVVRWRRHPQIRLRTSEVEYLVTRQHFPRRATTADSLEQGTRYTPFPAPHP